MLDAELVLDRLLEEILFDETLMDEKLLAILLFTKLLAILLDFRLLCALLIELLLVTPEVMVKLLGQFGVLPSLPVQLDLLAMAASNALAVPEVIPV